MADLHLDEKLVKAMTYPHTTNPERNHFPHLKEMRRMRRMRNPAAQQPYVESPELGEESFVGMWRDRQDMEDSSAWVRRLRKREWAK